MKQPEEYLKYHGIILKPDLKKKVIRAMEDYKNQTGLLFETDTVFDVLISEWNKANIEKGLKGRIRVLDKKTRNQYTNLRNAGYSVQDVINAYKKAMDEDYHKSTNFKYLTPEFITRVDKFNKFHNAENFANKDAGDYGYNFGSKKRIS